MNDIYIAAILVAAVVTFASAALFWLDSRARAKESHRS